MCKMCIIFSILLIGCTVNNSKNSVKSIPSIEILEKDINNNFNYSNLIDTLKVIRLETNDQSRIGKIRKILVKNSIFYIHDGSTSSIFKFDKNGKFLNKLEKKGRGPGEYYELRDFDVDDYGNMHILSYNEILIYNSDCKFIREKKLQIIDKNSSFFPAILLSTNKDYTFLFRGSFGVRDFKQKKSYALCSVDNNNNIISKYFPVMFKYPYTHQTFCRSDSNVYLTTTIGNDTIYKVGDSVIEPFTFIDFGNKRMKESYIINNRQNLHTKVELDKLCGSIRYVYENENYLCFIFNYGVQAYQAVYDKNNSKIIIANALDGDMPYPGAFIVGVIDKFFFSFSESYLFVADTEYYEKYKNILIKNDILDLKDTDNPLIFKFSFNL